MIIKKEISTMIALFCLLFLFLQIVGCIDGDISAPPSEPGKCELKNPNPSEKYECQSSCEGSCSGDWHLEGSCTYSCGFLWLGTCDGGYCCPDNCEQMGGYTCEGGEVCPGDWLNPLTGEDNCCSETCVLPCGRYDDKTSSCSNLIYVTELDLGIPTLINDLGTDMNSAGVQTLINQGGISICLDVCYDLKYAVEGECGDGGWCQKCAEPPAEKCCIYCPPKTVYVAGEGCEAPSCYPSCQEATGLPYNDPADESSYPDEGYSICKAECVDKDLGDGVIWEAYAVNTGNTWCSEINGGTDFEDYTQCCAYCPPETHYSPASKSCEPDSDVSELTWKLDCPYIILFWGEYANAISYKIIPFYDEDKDKTEDGICEDDIVSLGAEERQYYYNLELSSCVEHYTGNVKLQLIPQYSGAMSTESYSTDWIDVSVCELKAKPKDCEDGTLHNSCSNNKPYFCDNGELVPDCPVCGCPDGYGCNTTEGSCYEVFQECGNNIREGAEDCDGTDDDACPGMCRNDCTCPPSECDDSKTGPNGDWDKDGICNDDDPDKDGDGVPNHADNEEWTILGCKADNYGVAIDNDKDGICKVLDCNDNDASIKITKDDPACTREMLCSNEELDIITNEIEIDLGGLCRPYIKLVQPLYGVSETDAFDLVVSTDHDANCRFSIDVSLLYSNMYTFSTSGGKTHTKTGFSLGDENTHKLYVKCDDGYWPADEAAEFELAVDSSKPIIKIYYAEPNPIIERPVETVLVVGTDDKTRCKYDLNEQKYESMKNKFPKFDEPEFSKEHTQTISNLPDNAKDYTYYVACENRAGLVSDTKDILVSVDLSQDLIVTSTTNRYTNESRIYLSVKTNKNAQCFYNNISTDITKPFGDSAYEHKKLLTQLSEGDHRYYVKCYKEGLQSPTTTIIFTVDTSLVSKPWVNDTSTIDDYPEYSYYTDRLRVKWKLDKKPLSGIKHFIYMLEDLSGNLTVNWTKSTEEDEWIWVDEDHNGNELNLTKGTKYFFSVIAISNAGSSSEAGKSDGVTIDPSKKPVTCTDLELNGDETSIDCGGDICPKCELYKNCLVNDDCLSKFCNSSKKCAKPSCDDGIKNGNETDVDCGGSCSKCENDDECKKDSDCKSGKCDSNLKICIGIDTCANNRLDSDETDVDCGGNCAEKKDKKCDDGENCKKNSDCNSGSCLNNKCVAFEKDSDNDGIPDKDDNCDYISNKGQEDTDGDGIGDACDTDNDNDEMPDAWEKKYGLDPYFNDANEDKDNDGLTNLEEYKYGTDPTNKDTDGDGVSDGDEVEKGFDPADPDSHPEFNFWPIFFLITGIIFLLAGIGYLLYKKSTKPKEKKPFRPIKPTTQFRQPFGPERTSSLELRRKQAMEKIIRDRERFKEHDKAFGTFTTPPKTDVKEKLQGRLDIGKPEVVKPVPKKTTTTKKTPITNKKSVKKKEKKPRDVFEELSKVATAELKKYKKK